MAPLNLQFIEKLHNYKNVIFPWQSNSIKIGTLLCTRLFQRQTEAAALMDTSSLAFYPATHTHNKLLASHEWAKKERTKYRRLFLKQETHYNSICLLQKIHKQERKVAPPLCFKCLCLQVPKGVCFSFCGGDTLEI